MANQAETNYGKLKGFFEQRLADLGREGVVGVAKFQDVYARLMPEQQARLEYISGERFDSYLKHGSIICIGLAYPESAITAIDAKTSSGSADKASWCIYAKEYRVLNETLDAVAREIAERFGGIVIPPVTGAKLTNVENYYGKTISHRVVAEHAGLGWRGKNELLVNERFGCAIRFASIVTDFPLPHGEKIGVSCGKCTACVKVCAILKNKSRLPNYRANCLEYIMGLGLEADVCGKCVKACIRDSVYSSQFKLK